MPPHPSQKSAPEVKRRCHRCRGSGREPCRVCGGAGQVVLRLDQRGRPETARCSGCFGTKALRCTQCSGTGFL